jgi:uncharacterized protein (DUF1697 family)
VRIALLLRGVNVGGVTVRSADLRALLSDAGLGDVATVLASGNAVVTATDAAAAARAAEVALEARYGRRIRVLGVAIDDLERVIAGYPHAEDDEHTPYVVFELEPGVAAELAALAPGEGEELAAGEGVVHWSNPKGMTLTSPFGTALERHAKDRVTTRNLRTLRRIVAVA